MSYDDLLSWANGQTTMYLVADGEMKPIDYYTYSIMPLAQLPANARLTTDARLAYIISEYQRRRGGPS